MGWSQLGPDAMGSGDRPLLRGSDRVCRMTCCPEKASWSRSGEKGSKAE